MKQLIKKQSNWENKNTIKLKKKSTNIISLFGISIKNEEDQGDNQILNP